MVTGFSGPEACALAGITYRQCDYWARIGLVEPSLRKPIGSGDRRRYSVDDVRLLMLLGKVEPSQRKIVAEAVRENGGTCRRLLVNTSTNAVFCCNTDADVLAAVKGGGVITMFDLDQLLPDLDDNDRCPDCGVEFPVQYGPHPTWTPCDRHA